ncbi:acyl carrier protein [Clostridiaceae bacterium]|nr:acyl carrier protein [Clostridiaceae bacterium]RKI08567.1 acyl carrier protein [bacterium 1XD21-70]
MKREEVFERLNEIFRSNFDDEGITLTDRTSSEDIEDWDSLEQVNLVVAIQGAFHVKFNIDEVNAMGNVGEMVDAILQKAGAKDE